MAIRRLNRRIAGEPGMPMLIPGQQNGKKSIRRIMRRDPSIGLSMPEADQLTNTRTQVIGTPSPTVLSASKNAPQPTGAGRKTISKLTTVAGLSRSLRRR